LLSFSESDSDEILAWYSRMQPVKQVAIAQFFSGEPIDRVSDFLQDADNRRRVDRILDAMMGHFAPERLHALLEATMKGLGQKLQSLDERMSGTIDQGALLVDPGFGNGLLGVFGHGMRAKVKSSHLEIKTRQGPVSIRTDKITTVDLIRRMFGGVDARIETTDGSTFQGKLLTKDIEVVYESSGALARIECRTLGGIRAFKREGDFGRVNFGGVLPAPFGGQLAAWDSRAIVIGLASESSGSAKPVVITAVTQRLVAGLFGVEDLMMSPPALRKFTIGSPRSSKADGSLDTTEDGRLSIDDGQPSGSAPYGHFVFADVDRQTHFGRIRRSDLGRDRNQLLQVAYEDVMRVLAA